MSADGPINIKGIGQKTAQKLAKMGIERLDDFLTFFPRAYEDRSKTVSIFEAALAEGKVCVRGMVRGTPMQARTAGGRTVTRAAVCDDSGAMEMVFFNQPYVKNSLKSGVEYVFFGKTEVWNGRKSMVNPLFERADARSKTGGITPVYRGTQGLGSGVVPACVAQVLDMMRGRYAEVLPPEIIEKYRFCTPQEAFENIHRPHSWAEIGEARRRLAFEELFLFCLATDMMRERSRCAGEKLERADENIFFASLPFSPTGAQRRAVSEAFEDMCSGRRMNRLLQGDVGSGKTLVAAACAYLAVKNGGQAVIMAPTELLANQHFENMRRFFSPFDIECVCLTSDMAAARKKEVKNAIKSGVAQVICGTHALIQQDVEYAKPYLFVVDEQHRFGVRQRAALLEKSGGGHFLMMSATPIPRTLTLIIYGDLSVSVLDELPPGRKPVLTYTVPEEKRAGMYGMIRDIAKNGGQTYIVCPLIEEGEEDDSRKAAAAYAQKLQKSLPELRIGVMHGKLKAAEKDAVMEQFSNGNIDVLVSTTVVEVGTDVPNAQIMVVENAELFGLSQLHQLRGRVGRGSGQAYCFLMNQGGGNGKERLDIMRRTTDGFKIAEEDLKLRGPGDFFGDRQHGTPEFLIADIAANTELLTQAKREADAVFAADRTLAGNPALQKSVALMLKSRESAFN